MKLNKEFSKDETQMPKTLQKCLAFLAFREMQIRTTLRFLLTLVIMVKIDGQTDNTPHYQGCRRGEGK